MVTIKYEDTERQGILAAQESAGMRLIEDRRLQDGNVMIFGTIAEHAATFPPQAEDEIAALKKKVTILELQVATLSGKIGTVESKVAIMEAMPIDQVVKA